jgi:hypothetical protein
MRGDVVCLLSVVFGPLTLCASTTSGHALLSRTLMRIDLNANHDVFRPRGSTRWLLSPAAQVRMNQQGSGPPISIAFWRRRQFHMGPVSPYITAGLAGFNIKTKLSDAIEGAEDKSDTKFAVNGAWVFP